MLPLAPSLSRLPWAVENLRFCPWCDQLAQKDLNDCPTCGRRMGPLRPGENRLRVRRVHAPGMTAPSSPHLAVLVAVLLFASLTLAPAAAAA